MRIPAHACSTILRRCRIGLMLAAVLAIGTATAAEPPFGRGWTLVPGASRLDFLSVKSLTKVEPNSFASFAGAIAPDGAAVVTVQLDSIDTGIDLRNVRMRFLFFETFRFPEATVSLRLDAATLRDLPVVRRKTLPVRFTLDLHGVTRELAADVVVTLVSEGLVSVASAGPISVAAAEFGLADGVKKLEEAADVAIIPSGLVSFDFAFRANAPGAAPPAVAARPPPQSTALEAHGAFSPEACSGRFEIISRTGAIYFRTGSADLDAESRPLLDSVVAIVARCPGLNIEIAGHTDSTGTPALNQDLSVARARAVAAYLTRQGVPAARLAPVGFGDTRPVAPNDTAWNMSRNRRIAFSVGAR